MDMDLIAKNNRRIYRNKKCRFDEKNKGTKKFYM